jgi:hypothetical protein
MPGGVREENPNLAQEVIIAIVVFKDESIRENQNSSNRSRGILLSE